ncbi:MAG: hypothetical protein HY518_03715 [Candidatus Aenigmarchaeota archaeon]|nr:hypothetical protein [Candidatus Aenigmarchaeota archaeon]
MTIIGFKFTTVEGKREKDAIKGEVKVSSTPTITEVKEADLQQIDKKALSLRFEFITAYEPDIGVIKVGGEVFYIGDNSANVLKQWKTKKMLPEEVGVEILNYLFRRCLLKISAIAEDLQLPPPIGFPRVKPKEPATQTAYVG